MPFEAIETETKENMPATALISYMRPKARGKNAAKQERDDTVRPQFLVTLPTSVCVSKAKRFKLFVGTGAERGKVRIKSAGADDKSAAKVTDRKHCVVIKFGFVPKFGTDIIFDNERCPVRQITVDEYELDVPIDLLAAQAGADKKRAA